MDRTQRLVLGRLTVSSDGGEADGFRCSRGLGRSPLKTEAIAIGILQTQLLHTVVSDDWLLHIKACEPKMRIRGVQGPTAEVERGIAMSVDPGGIWIWRSFAPFVQGVEHDLRIVQPEECPVTVVARPIRRNDLEAKQITVERDCFRHVENPEERTNAFDLQSHREPPLFSGQRLSGRP